jgi:hypothetical protein
MAELRTSQISALRRAIDCLPERTRQAMLVGISNNTIVVGAYTHADGICPMLAAHRNGGRTDFVAFSRAWDEYCFRGLRARRRRPRLATPSELITLRAHIESSLLAEDEVDLVGAMAAHRALVTQRQAREPEPEPERASRDRKGRVRPGDPDRSKEFSRRHGWRWLRIMRSFDEYEQAMAALDEQAGAEAELTGNRTETELAAARG